MSQWESIGGRWAYLHLVAIFLVAVSVRALLFRRRHHTLRPMLRRLRRVRSIVDMVMCNLQAQWQRCWRR